jgi:hypothetical protein
MNARITEGNLERFGAKKLLVARPARFMDADFILTSIRASQTSATSGKLHCLGQNTFSMIERLTDWSVNVVTTTDCLSTDRANCRFWCFAQSPKLFSVIAQAGLTPRDQQLIFRWCIEDLYGDHRVIINQMSAAQAVCYNFLQFLSLNYSNKGYGKSSSNLQKCYFDN